MRAETGHFVEARVEHHGLARGYGARLRQTAYPHPALPVVAQKS